MTIENPVNYFAMALDPIHVGSGKQGLGRVDLPIVREEATKLPIIPGSSICGVTRAAVAIDAGQYLQCAGKSDETDSNRTHCGQANCRVCVAFGFSNKGLSFQGLASFYDARLLFFPVHTLVGTVWITSKNALEGTGIEVDNNETDDFHVLVSPAIDALLPPAGAGNDGKKVINLGWLRMPVLKTIKISVNGLLKESKENETAPLAYIASRSVLVSNTLFSRIINFNLETRTSVSIDPATGAAEKGALFTYEAVPRSAVFFFQVGIANPRHFRVNKEEIPDSIDRDSIQKDITLGLQKLQYLGIGGMNTRGMGRINVWEGVWTH